MDPGMMVHPAEAVQWFIQLSLCTYTFPLRKFQRLAQGQNQKWLLKSCNSGAHMWAKWVHNRCRLEVCLFLEGFP